MDIRERMMSVLRDDAVFQELRRGNFIGEVLRNPHAESVSQFAEGKVARFAEGAAAGPGLDAIADAADRIRGGDFNPNDMAIAEAIVVRFGNPSLLVQNGTYVEPALEVWKQRLERNRTTINGAIAATGRIEVVGLGADISWLGTGWLIDATTVVTNRHVAQFFVSGAGTSVRLYPDVNVSIDYREEHGVEGEPVSEIADVVYLEPHDSNVDIAILRLARSDHGITPIPLGRMPDGGGFVGVIGYPAFSPYNSPTDQARIFEDIYDKKRFAPGEVIASNSVPDIAFAHNCTTLGGNSGSVVIDVATGAAVGLHYGGVEGDRNEAVRVDVIRERADRMKVGGRPARGQGRAKARQNCGAEEAKARLVSDYAGREGYSSDFLGDGARAVPLPKLNALQARDAARLADGSIELRYQNFSLVMNAARRLVFFTAVNIDGTDLWHKPRGRDVWRLDPRIPAEAQVDDALYANNDFDRGHIVRRLDPVWGDKTLAVRAEEDTFHYTNATPQHKRLNQGIWVDLENHVLAGAEDDRARISVLCGPVFGYADPRSKRPGLEEVGIPLGYWKVIASLGEDRRRRAVLEAQAFVIWQRDMIGRRDLERVFGQGFETYQVSLAALERLSGLDFGTLREADTLGEDPVRATTEAAMATFRENAVPIRAPADIL